MSERTILSAESSSASGSTGAAPIASILEVGPLQSVRDACGVGLLAISFVCACFFYSVGYNLVFLLGSSGCLLLALGLFGSKALVARSAAQPVAALVALFALVALLMLQLVISISPESSHAPSWVIASAPIWFYAALAVRQQHWVWLTLLALVGLIAAVGFVRFLLEAQRAYDPLADASNLGALLYLAWIPATHWLLVRIWYGPRSPALVPLLAVGSFVVLVTLFATASRAAQALVAVAIVGWLILALLRRQSLWPVVMVGVSALLAYLLFFVRSPELMSAMIDSGEAVVVQDQRQLMLSAALDALRANGVWGTGIFTFSLLYPLYRPLGDQSSAGLYVHNDFLQLLLEGGVWLALPLALFVGGVLLRCAQSLSPRQSISQLSTAGGYWALAALFVHALVNFVFYTLALAIAAGVVAAWAQSNIAPRPPAKDDARGFFGWLFGLLFGLVCLAYLVLDVLNLSVFSGQSSLGFASQFRSSPAAQLQFAKRSEELNGDRGLPVLGQALLLEAQYNAKRTSGFLLEQTVATYERAIVKDPWNPIAYVRFAEFLQAIGEAAQQQTEQVPEALLQQALALNPADIDTLMASVRFYQRANQPQIAYGILKSRAYPWLDLIMSSKPAAGMGLLQQLGAYAQAAGDDEFFAELRAQRQRYLDKPVKALNPVWFMQWRAQTSARNKP